MASAACSGGVDRDAYVEKNEELLESVPVFPRANRIDVSSSPYRGADGEGSPRGYTTTFRFRLPATATRQEVARFYKNRLAGDWVLLEELVEGGGERVVNFRRDDASLSVNLESQDVLELTADHDSYGKLGRPD
jgi:hypothetical protein